MRHILSFFLGVLGKKNETVEFINVIGPILGIAKQNIAKKGKVYNN